MSSANARPGQFSALDRSLGCEALPHAAPGQTFAGVYRERQPLYERYADATIDCSGLSHDIVVQRIIAALGN